MNSCELLIKAARGQSTPARPAARVKGAVRNALPLAPTALVAQHDQPLPTDQFVPKDQSVMVRDFILSTVATVFEVDPGVLQQPSRGRARAALARQVAMYLAHVACGLSLTAVGRVFGRDRSTVSHACRRVEDAREVLAFDRAIAMMERSVRMIVRTSPALRRDLELAEQGRVSC